MMAKIVGVIVALVLGFIGGYFVGQMKPIVVPSSVITTQTTPTPTITPTAYNPVINPTDFTTVIDTTYLKLPIGRELDYKLTTAEGSGRDIIKILPNTKQIMGVSVVTYEDTVILNGKTIEHTLDYLAQNKTDGNIWYFGEDVNNYDPKTGAVNHDGAWIAGENGALPGLWLKNNPVLGETYRQEYLKGSAEDMRTVISTNDTVQTATATYTNCEQIYDWTVLEPTSHEYKYYCPSVGAEVLDVDIGDNERAELVSIK